MKVYRDLRNPTFDFQNYRLGIEKLSKCLGDPLAVMVQSRYIHRPHHLCSRVHRVQKVVGFIVATFIVAEAAIFDDHGYAELILIPLPCAGQDLPG